MVKLQIEIYLNGKAFDEPGPELSRILARLAARFESGIEKYNGFLSNDEGSPVGHYRFIGGIGRDQG